MSTARRWGLPAVLGLALALSSAGRFGNTLGRDDADVGSVVVWAGILAATVAYTAFVAGVWWVVGRLSPRRADLALLVVVGLAVVAFLVVYPRYGAPTDDRGYGDADDALDILADSVTDGFDPYDRVTYVDNELSPLPGAGVLAVPLRQVAGSAAYQNPLWLLVGVAVLRRRWGGRVALGVTVPVLASLGVAEHYLLGGDWFTSGVAAALVAYGFLAGVERGGWWPWLWALALGLVTANRATTLPVLALVAAVLWAGRRLGRGAGPLTLAVVVNLALWVPWWLDRPDDFPPFQRVDLIGPTAARGLALGLLLAALAWIAAGRWWRPGAGPPAERLAREGWLLAAGGLPAVVWAPVELARTTAYLWFAVPWLADRLDARLTGDHPPAAADG